jgi:hypothetical protein
MSELRINCETDQGIREVNLPVLNRLAAWVLMRLILADLGNLPSRLEL